MSATFKGHKTGFNPSGSNSCVPNEMGPPKTTFKGRGGVPEGQLQRYPGATADIATSNRRMAKAAHGEGAGMGTAFKTHTGFGPNLPGEDGRASQTYNTGGGKGSGFRKDGSKKP